LSLNWSALFWLLATLGVYVLSRALYARMPRWWTSPLLATWLMCSLLLLACHASYQEYFSGGHWLVLLLGPATVAFAIPIYEQRVLIKRHWLILLVGIVGGSGLALGSAWAMANALHLSPEMRASLMPRSVTTPFAMAVAQRLGGVAELTASLTAVTGLFGAAIGELLIKWLPLRSAFARGAMYGMGAHGAGVAKAREIGEEEGAVAGVIMISAGLLNVVGASLFVMVWRPFH